ncbi:hypothetical protein U9M48_034957 [Paspalum notatum var. saurae]|uniref:Uncharacterized protein n=1 Tax=Paspalum notatum var. saurae TaxID=547442 RepID=A0AAQ3X8E3_PASNO
MAKKMVVVAAAVLLLVALALDAAAPASAMDCQAGCAELKVKGSPFELVTDCEKRCAEIAASRKEPHDPNKDAKWDIP